VAFPIPGTQYIDKRKKKRGGGENGSMEKIQGEARGNADDGSVKGEKTINCNNAGWI